MTENPISAEHGGLSQGEAEARLAAGGPNELAGGGRQSLIGIVREVLREPMLLFLVAAGAIYFVLGDLHEALILTVFAGLTVGIAVTQEVRSDRAIAALGELASPLATVIRDGQRRALPAREVVCGDLLVVSEGGRVVADGWVVSADGLQVDEAILTGESVPVVKPALGGAMPPALPAPGGETMPCVFSGTLVVRGTGLVAVMATGPRTAMGALGRSLATIGREEPRLAVQSRAMVRWFAGGGLAVSALAVVLYGLLRGGWVDGLLSGIALAMSLMPEELPVVLTLFMTMGALRLSRARVLARRGTAIETLGAATVLCTDKTGTLTENRMAIEELRLPDGGAFRPGEDGAAFPEAFVDLARAGILACPLEPFDPMEQAFHAMARAHPSAGLTDRQEAGWALHRHYALAPDLLAMSHVWTSGRAEDARLVAAKGAPEAIAGLCGLAPGEVQAMERVAADMAARGLRVLGVAMAEWAGADLPPSQRHFAFRCAGLVGLADPVRAAVPGAVRDLQAAGIRVVMITGDYPATARAIAGEAGIAAGATLTGEDMAALDDTALARRIPGVAVFARVLPEQKLRIVEALKAAGEVVAMIGDGVNDAPSLVAAHIGVAMGQRGTDVAREASALVLLDDDFGAIPRAVRLGRRIYDNIRKAAGFIFAVHLPIAGLAIVPLLTGWPLIVGPVHIALLEMVIDPVCSLAFEAEPEEAGIMRRPPRAPDSPLISRVLAIWAGVQGVVALALLLGLAVWARGAGLDEGAFRATCFAGLIVAVLMLVWANRSLRAGLPRRKGANLVLGAILGAAVPFFVLLFLFEPVASLFGFAVLARGGIVAIGVMGLALVAALHGVKRLLGRALAG
ncbi:cation-translocating P-type ATPase [Novosphingobium bradum]|uniref:Cation-translocating P-type ATPase n=1 Tax=Novosphingobium bradum TaxID=1737444 RepID=A0ABV7IMY7_9SPHN